MDTILVWEFHSMQESKK